MVLDRVFLYVFGITALFGSFLILSKSPAEDPEHSVPIDVIYSKIAAEEFRMFEEKLFAWTLACFFLPEKKIGYSS